MRDSTTWYGANYASRSPCRLDRLRATKMAGLGDIAGTTVPSSYASRRELK